MMELVLLVTSSIEILLILTIFFLFFRMRRFEGNLSSLREKQRLILEKLRFNEELEKKLVESFEVRQKELIFLDKRLKEKTEELKNLIKCAEEISSSPQFIKEIILRGYKKGKSLKELSQKTGLSEEEVELIIDQHCR